MATTLTEALTTPEQNKAIIHRWCAEVFNQKKVDVVDELKVSEYADWTPFPGQAPTLEAYKHTLRLFFVAFPDFHYTVSETIAEGEMGVVRGRWAGTHTGNFLGLPPSGKKVGGQRIDMFRFAQGKMSEHWGCGLELAGLELMGFSAPTNGSVDGDGNKGHALQFVKQILNDRNLVAIDGLVEGYTSDHFKQALGLLLVLGALPDAELTVEHVVAEGDKVAVHSTLTGTHQGRFLGIEPTGKPVSIAKIDMFRFSGGKIVESWPFWDNAGLLVQLGALPAGLQLIR